MRWFEPIPCDHAVANPLVTDSHDLHGHDEYDFIHGRPFSSWDGTAWLKSSRPEDDEDPDDVLQNHLGLPIYSPRLRDALTAEGIQDIEYLPVRIFRPHGEFIQGFAIANILSVVPALDTNRSDYDTYPEDYFLPGRRGDVSGVRRAVLLAPKLQGRDVIRLAEFPLDIFVSEAFRSAFERGGFTGYSFTQVEVSGLQDVS